MHTVKVRSFPVPSGYLKNIGGSYAGSCSCWSGANSSNTVFTYQLEDLVDDRVDVWNECFHSYLDGTLYMRAPVLINKDLTVQMSGCEAKVLARYSTGHALVMIDSWLGIPKPAGYCVVKYSSYWGRWERVLDFFPGGVHTGSGYVGNYQCISSPGYGTASFQYSDDRYPGEIICWGETSYIGNGQFSVTGLNLWNHNDTSGYFIGDITTSNVQALTRDEADRYFTSVSRVRRVLDAKYVFENRKAVERNVIKCISQADFFDLNMIAFAKDFKEFKDTLLSLQKLLKGKVNLKNVASLHLVKKYVVQTTARDIETIISKAPVIATALRSHQNQMRTLRFHTRDSSVSSVKVSQLNGIIDTNVSMTETTVCTLYLDPKVPTTPIGGFLRLLDKFDALPTLENLWDLVPYSFVVDWFIDLGDNFEALRADRKQSEYNLLAHIYSQTNEATLTATGYFSGALLYNNYRRVVSKSWPGFSFQLNFSLPITHILELGALVVQRM